MSRWIIPFWCACWIAWQTGIKSSSRCRGLSRPWSQYSVIGHALDEFHHKKRPACIGRTGVEHLGDVEVFHHGEGLPLGLEAGDHLGAVHAGFDDLQRDPAADRPILFGHEDGAHAPLADFLQQLVGTNPAASAFDRRRNDRRGHRVERIPAMRGRDGARSGR